MTPDRATPATPADHVGPGDTVPLASSAAEATAEPVTGVRYPTVEAVRFIAASLVVATHVGSILGPDRAGAFSTPAIVGDAGVSIFFVLSGFLIFRPYVAAAHFGDPVPGPLTFWWRRALRVIPAYWLALAFFANFGSIEFTDVGNMLRYVFLVHIYKRTTAIDGITQSWSLAVEISFYLLVPLFGWLALQARRRLGSLGLWVVPLALFAAGFVARWGLSALDEPGRVSQTRQISFLWLPTNIDHFAIGMGIAVISVVIAERDATSAPHPRRALVERVAQPLALWWAVAVGALLAYAYLVGQVALDVGYLGWFWQRRQLVYGFVGLCFVLPCALGVHRGQLRRLLACRPLHWAGVLSYGLYLWHLDWLKMFNEQFFEPDTWVPVERLSQPPVSWIVFMAVGLGLGYLGATVSWFGVERPLARFRSPGLLERRRASKESVAAS